MRYCKDCWNFDRCNVERKTVEFAVDDGVCLNFDGKPMTNADRIRAMSDEELADFLNRVKEPCDYCELARVMGACADSLCDSAMERWLQLPVEGE